MFVAAEKFVVSIPHKAKPQNVRPHCMDNFKIISTISQDTFIEKWSTSEKYNFENELYDKDTWDRINSFSLKKLDIFLIEINPSEVFNCMFIPHHAADHHYFKTRSGGQSIQNFINDYSFNEIQENYQNICSKRIQSQIDNFKKQKESGHLFTEGFFMYCTHEVELAVGQSVQEGRPLFSGSFHQFAAYGLFIKEYGPIPLRLYLCNNAA